MATPKLDNISLHFSRRINDSKTSANVEFTTGQEDGKTLSALQRMEYINEAMFKLMGMIWKVIQGDKAKFVQIFPELVRDMNITLSSGGTEAKYQIANPNLDFWHLLEGVLIIDASTKRYAEIAPKHLFQAITYGAIQFRATDEFPKVIEMEREINAFPVATYSGKSAIFTIITQPLNPTNGAFLTQAGSYDSPFYDNWNDQIIDLAVELFHRDTGDAG